MEPPLKRPRLSMFADEPYSPELDQARIQNDLLLKSRFEAIFAKYSEDFTDVGDEIDLNSLEIAVDNGHLAAIQSENDTGKTTQRSASLKDGTVVANGKSMLRAMTLAPDRDDSFFEDEEADDVIQSIETIAGVINISSGEDQSDDDRNDGEEDTPIDEDGAELAREPGLLPRRDPESLNRSTQTVEKEDSDGDSLFDVKQDYRESSVDSLFAVDTPPTSAGIERNSEEQQVIAKFGENVGREVLNFLATRDRAEPHIEPAWRIPVKIPEQPRSSLPRMDGTFQQLVEVRDSTGNTTTPDLPGSASASQHVTPSPNKGKSLWKGPARRTKTQIRRDEIWQKVREESEDPLQDGFNSAESSTFEEDPDEEADLERCSRIIKRGLCPWCKEQYNGRHRVLQHLRRIIRKHEKGEPFQGYHNVEHIIRVRPKIIEHDKVRGRGTRPPRLLICDFKSVVELHEAAGYSLDYIIAEKILHTKKQDVDKLRGLYEKYRTVEDDDDGDTYEEPWTKKEEKQIADLISKPFGTMDTIRRRMRTRSDKEIGDYLAEKWLKQCRGQIGVKIEAVGNAENDERARGLSPEDMDEERNASGMEEDSTDDLFIGPSFPASTSATFIKQEVEDSEVDELFVPNVW